MRRARTMLCAFLLAPSVHARDLWIVTKQGGVTSGSITISGNGRYGALEGKAVAVEPATGFTLDTPLVTRPR